MIFWIPLVPPGKFDITPRLAGANMNGAAGSSVTITSEPGDTHPRTSCFGDLYSHFNVPGAKGPRLK